MNVGLPTNITIASIISAVVVLICIIAVTHLINDMNSLYDEIMSDTSLMRMCGMKCLQLRTRKIFRNDKTQLIHQFFLHQSLKTKRSYSSPRCGNIEIFKIAICHLVRFRNNEGFHHVGLRGGSDGQSGEIGSPGKPDAGGMQGKAGIPGLQGSSDDIGEPGGQGQSGIGDLKRFMLYVLNPVL
uniref:Col_cuticle_N domain-containing protein n=1 Tax=Onchocerca volvulus TaxID=6282 RepID=A0A8R1Y2H3_ONCVO